MDKKEAKRLYDKEYRKKNRDKIKAYNSTLERKLNKTNYGKNWRKNNIEKKRIDSWKFAGIISEDWEATYNYYINCTNCEWCEEPFNPDIKNGKCLDHDHNINNEVNIRGVLCRDCNWNDYLGKFMQTLLN